MMTDPKTGETRLNTVARLTRGMSFGVSGSWSRHQYLKKYLPRLFYYRITSIMK